MAKLLPIIFKGSAELKKTLLTAAERCGLNLSAFIRQACIEKANRVLGKPPTLPVHVATKDKH